MTYKIRWYHIALVLFIASVLYSCTDDNETYVQAPVQVDNDGYQVPMRPTAAPPPAPVVVQPSPQPVIVNNDDGNSGFMHGLIMGHLLHGNNSSTHTTIVKRTYITKTPRYYGRPSRSFSRSYRGGRR